TPQIRGDFFPGLQSIRQDKGASRFPTVLPGPFPRWIRHSTVYNLRHFCCNVRAPGWGVFRQIYALFRFPLSGRSWDAGSVGSTAAGLIAEEERILHDRKTMYRNVLLLAAACCYGQSDFRGWDVSGGGTPQNIHYSALNQITPQNVGNLKVAWTFDSGDA